MIITVDLQAPDLERLWSVIATGEYPILQSGLRRAAGEYLDYARQRFQENSRGGGDWPPLAQSTIDARARRQNPGMPLKSVSRSAKNFPILFDSGRLYGSLYSGATENILEVDGLFARYGTMVPYGKFHRTGTSRMPVRDFAPVVDDPTRDRIHDILAEAVRKTLESAMSSITAMAA